MKIAPETSRVHRITYLHFIVAVVCG